MAGKPPPPGPTEPPSDWEHYELYTRVKKAIYSLPTRFESSLSIAGVLATDLFAFNSSLGATIEEQVVASLNRLRSVWDPDQSYALYDFERQPQTFPDVVLKASSPNVTPTILMGVELKGWYVLAKEREPSFRYRVTPSVCAPADLLVVVPWALSNVISGSPMVFQPFVIGARQAAEYRNWYWEHERTGNTDQSIRLADVAQYYPAKSDMISDSAASDRGGNFGRFARTGVMDPYMEDLFQERLSGITLAAWQRFLSIFTESSSTEEVDRALERLSTLLSTASQASTEQATALQQKLRELAELLDKGT